MRNLHVVTTPENVPFDFELAGVAARALAWFLDVLVMAAMIMVASCVLSMAAPALGGLAIALLMVAIFLVQWWYSALCEWWLGGQTLGKKAVGLRTLDERGLRMSFLQAVVRNLVRFVDLLPILYLVGGVSAIVDGRGRRLGDIAAGTIVVRVRNAPKPSAVVPVSERYNTFVRDPSIALAARRITPPERDAMIALGLRREDLPLAVRHELFSRMSEHLENRVGVRRPAYFSEEKFVLNLTAVVLGQAHERISLLPHGPTR